MAFVSSEELWRSRRVLSTLAFATSVEYNTSLLNLHNSSDTQPHSIIAKCILCILFFNNDELKSLNFLMENISRMPWCRTWALNINIFSFFRFSCPALIKWGFPKSEWVQGWVEFFSPKQLNSITTVFAQQQSTINFPVTWFVVWLFFCWTSSNQFQHKLVKKN